MKLSPNNQYTNTPITKNLTLTLKIDTTIELELTLHSWLKFDRLCGYREREMPSPIPNLEAKPLFADNTAGFTCGNVGRRIVDRGLFF